MARQAGLDLFTARNLKNTAGLFLEESFGTVKLSFVK